MSKKQEQLKKTKNAMPLAPRSWDNNAHRLDALKTFITNLANKDERQKCCSSPRYAKRKFAEWGGFLIEGATPPPGIEPIPKNTKFLVHRHGSNRLRRDKRVVIVLPWESGDETEKLLDVGLWRCSYTPYAKKYRKRSRR